MASHSPAQATAPRVELMRRSIPTNPFQGNVIWKQFCFFYLYLLTQPLRCDFLRREDSRSLLV